MSQSDVLIIGMKGLGVEIGELRSVFQNQHTQLPRSWDTVTGSCADTNG